jgi:hopanoid-associated phosphorylase
MILAAVGMLKEVRLVQAAGVRAVAGGGRSDLLEQRLKAAFDGAEAVISIGVGGALDPSLSVGDIVVGTEVLRPRSRWETDPVWTRRLLARLPGAKSGAVYGSNDMVVNTLDKAKLRAKGGAILTDMESHVAAKLAASRRLPFAVVRVVSDTAGFSLPSAVLAGLKPNGGMNLIGVLCTLARDPGQLQALMRVGRDADQAFKVLRTVRAALGPDLGFSD